MPKNKEDKTFTMLEFLKYINVFVLKLYFMKNLKISPKVLPINIQKIVSRSKIYNLIQPFVVLLG